MPKRKRKASSSSKQSLLTSLRYAIIFLAIYAVLGIASAGVVFLFYHYGLLSYYQSNYLTESLSLLSFTGAVLVYMILFKKTKTQNVPSKLGLNLSVLTPKNLGIGVLIFAIIFLLEIAVTLISTVTNVTINTNVASVLAGAPMWFYIFTSIIEPINEEIMFRAFLVPRLGIVPSAIIFGLAHWSYNSTFGVEVIAAFIFGLLAGYVFRKTKSLYPGIVAHILVNGLAVLSILSGAG